MYLCTNILFANSLFLLNWANAFFLRFSHGIMVTVDCIESCYTYGVKPITNTFVQFYWFCNSKQHKATTTINQPVRTTKLRNKSLLPTDEMSSYGSVWRYRSYAFLNMTRRMCELIALFMLFFVSHMNKYYIINGKIKLSKLSTNST